MFKRVIARQMESGLKRWIAIGLALYVGLPVSVSRAEHYHVILFGGQSNMDGHDPAKASDLPPELQRPQSDVRYFNSNNITASFYTGDAFADLQPGKPVGGNKNLNAKALGPEVSFGAAMAKDHPANHYALIKFAITGTNLAKQWRAPSADNPKGGNIYANFRASVEKAFKALSDNGDTYQVDGMLWLQGEADSGSKEQAGAYQANLTAFIGDIRKNYGAEIPFIIGGIGNGGEKGMPFRSEVQAAQANVAASLKSVRYFSNDDLAKGLHFDANGQVQIGQRFAKALESIAEATRSKS